jgi:hypothetical protein
MWPTSTEVLLGEIRTGHFDRTFAHTMWRPMRSTSCLCKRGRLTWQLKLAWGLACAATSETDEARNCESLRNVSPTPNPWTHPTCCAWGAAVDTPLERWVTTRGAGPTKYAVDQVHLIWCRVPVEERPKSGKKIRKRMNILTRQH